MHREGDTRAQMKMFAGSRLMVVHEGAISWHLTFHPQLGRSLAEVSHTWHSLKRLQAFGGEMSLEEVETLFEEAGRDSSGRVGVESLANLLQQLQLQGNLFKIIKRYNTRSLA